MNDQSDASPSPDPTRSAPVLTWLEQHRGRTTAVVDGLAWGVALVYSTWLRYEFTFAPVDAGDLALLALFAAAVQVGLGRLQGLYTGRWRFGSFEEVAALVVTVGVTTALTFVVNLVFGPISCPAERSWPPVWSPSW